MPSTSNTPPVNQPPPYHPKPFRVAKYRTLPYEALPLPKPLPKNPQYANVKARVVCR